MSKKGLWRPLETMRFKFVSPWVPCRYLGGAPDQTFFRKIFVFFLFVKLGFSQKIVTQIQRIFGCGGGLLWGPSDLRPPPWANPMYAPGRHVPRICPRGEVCGAPDMGGSRLFIREGL